MSQVSLVASFMFKEEPEPKARTFQVQDDLGPGETHELPQPPGRSNGRRSSLQMSCRLLQELGPTTTWAASRCRCLQKIGSEGKECLQGARLPG